MGSNTRLTAAVGRESDCSRPCVVSEGLDVVFLPAGSFASNHCSTILNESGGNTQQEKEERMWGEDGQSRTFLPTQENVIIFESLSPVDSLKEERGGEEPRVSKFSQSLNPRQSTSTTHSLGSSLKAFQTGFLRAMAEGQDMAEIPELTTEGSRVGDATSERKRDEVMVWKELEDLRSNCRRYECQNEALRHELQSCTLDLQSLDRSKKKAISDNSHLRYQVSTALTLLSPLSSRLAAVLGTANSDVTSLEDLCEGLKDQVELLIGRFGRMKSVNECLQEENKTLADEMDRVKSRFEDAKETQNLHFNGDYSPINPVKASPGTVTSTPYNTPASSFLGKENRRPKAMDPSLVKGGNVSEDEGTIAEYSTQADQSRRPLIEASRDLQLAGHTRSRSIKDQLLTEKPREEKSKPRYIPTRAVESKTKPSSPCVRGHFKGTTPTRRNISPCCFPESNSTLKLSLNLASSTRLAQTTVLRGSKKTASQRPQQRKPRKE